jgi:hypothetical protein
MRTYINIQEFLKKKKKKNVFKMENIYNWK